MASNYGIEKELKLSFFVILLLADGRIRTQIRIRTNIIILDPDPGGPKTYRTHPTDPALNPEHC
jgi:hypothetical protein